MKYFCLAVATLAILSGNQVLAAAPLDYPVFDTCPLPGAYYYSSTTASSPSWVENLQGKLPCVQEPAFTPGSALALGYVSGAGGRWQAKVLHRPIRGQDEWDNGVFIQEKPTPFKKPEVLHFQLLAKDTEKAALPRVALIIKGDKTSETVPLTSYLAKPDATGWREARIPLGDFRGLTVKVAEEVKGVLFEQSGNDGQYHRIFLDQMDLRPAKDEPMPETLEAAGVKAKGFERHVDISWEPVEDERVQGVIVERANDGKNFKPVGFKQRYLSRYADYLGPDYGTYSYRVCLLGYDGTRSKYSPAVSATTRPFSDEELLDMVQEACARCYFEGAERKSGLTLESIPGDAHMIATGASGFGIMSLVVAASRGFVPREQVAARILKILDYLETEDHFHGAMAHYYDGTTPHPKLFFGPDDNGGDLVETSFLMQGLLTARQFFDRQNSQEKAIRDRITRLWEAVEWDWYRQKPDSPYLFWHWSPDKGWKINHRLIGWNETLITYLLAIASPTHAVPAQMFNSGFASQERLAQEYRGDGDGKMYTNGKTFFGQKLDVGGFTGGPIFFIHYNFLGMDPHRLSDRYTDYFKNSQAIARINLRYCQENPQHHFGYGSNAWGLTASDGPVSYNPDEPRPEGDKGKITPTGAVASMPYLPEESMAALKNYYRSYGSFLWGEYGFRDAFSLDDHWVNDLYMGLNQAPIVIMIENYRSGLPWKLFGSNAEIQKMRKAVFNQ